MSRLILWIVTLLRVFLIPVFLFFAVSAQEAAVMGEDFGPYRFAALGTLFLMGASDLVDGWIARRYALMSQVGAVADAVADKLIQMALAAFFALSIGPVFTTLPLWFLIAVFGRDLVLTVGVLMLRARYGAILVAHKLHGRAASVAVSGVLAWAALGLSVEGLLPLLVGATALTLASATAYALDGAAQGREVARLRG